MLIYAWKFLEACTRHLLAWPPLGTRAVMLFLVLYSSVQLEVFFQDVLFLIIKSLVKNILEEKERQAINLG